MTAIRAEDWDIWGSRLRGLSDALGEDALDRPGTVDKELYAHLSDEITNFYNEKIAPRLSLDIQSIANVEILKIDALKTGDNFADALPHIQAVYDIIPELAGRYETYERGLMRRRNTGMLLSTNPQLKEIFDAHMKGDLACFFDLDGSLVYAEPGRNVGYDADVRLQYVLNRLTTQTNSATAIVTGRPEMFLQQVFPYGQFFSATEHGVFVRDQVGGNLLRKYNGDVDIKALQATVSRQMFERGLSVKDCFVEAEKEGSLTVQFTNAADHVGASLHIGEILQQFMMSPRNAASVDPLLLVDGNVPGNRVMDLVPSTADKGKTLQWFYDEFPNIFQGKTPLMLGDSGGDETAMQWALNNGGYALGVGEAAPEIANVKLHSLGVARDFLTTMVEARANLDYQSKNPRAKPARLVI